MAQQQQQQQAAAAAPQIRGPRIRTFCSTDPEDFRTFERHVEYIIRIHEQWNNKRARLEIAQAMSGLAAEMTGHINIDIDHADPADVPDYHLLLDQYRACFTTDAHLDSARGEFNFAEQKDGETLINVHARLRSLFIRAYPNTPAAEVETSPQLMDRFLKSLRDQYVARMTYAQRPANYTAMLEVAATMETARNFTKPERMRPGRKSVHQLDGGSQFSGQVTWNRPNYTSKPSSSSTQGCFLCKDTSHWARDCPLKAAVTKAKANLGSDNPIQRGRGRGRGRARGRGRGGQVDWRQVRKSVASLTAALQAAEEEEEEEDAIYADPGGEDAEDEANYVDVDIDEDEDYQGN